jgi:glycosyltransferase involved in cell wall biosynthesis
MSNARRLRILGTRGIPARHGGFETFAEALALHLAARDWQVTVYCQAAGRGAPRSESWRGVELVHIPVSLSGALATALFDWRASLHAARRPGLVLTLGYNTAAFCAIHRLAGVPNLINMDGIEWRRAKWSAPMRAWLWLNERAGCWLGDHLVADHPSIAAHLATRTAPHRITTIPYGADSVTDADEAPVRALGLTPGRYATLVARPEPENSVLEIVRAFGRRPRGVALAVLGAYDPAHPYHARVLAAAGPEVRFLGPLYDRATVRALRFHSLLYCHGHQVGGTNPSLVEALGAGNPVLAHDNRFNRWVAGEAACYFDGEQQCAEALDRLLGDPAALAALGRASRARHAAAFTWKAVLAAYEALLERWLPGGAGRRTPVRAPDTAQ